MIFDLEDGALLGVEVVEDDDLERSTANVIRYKTRIPPKKMAQTTIAADNFSSISSELLDEDELADGFEDVLGG